MDNPTAQFLAAALQFAPAMETVEELISKGQDVILFQGRYDVMAECKGNYYDICLRDEDLVRRRVVSVGLANVPKVARVFMERWALAIMESEAENMLIHYEGVTGDDLEQLNKLEERGPLSREQILDLRSFVGGPNPWEEVRYIVRLCEMGLSYEMLRDFLSLGINEVELKAMIAKAEGFKKYSPLLKVPKIMRQFLRIMKGKE